MSGRGESVSLRAFVASRTEGWRVFHLGLVLGLLPGGSAIVALLARRQLDEADAGWRLRTYALAALDVLGIIAFSIGLGMAVQRAPQMLSAPDDGSAQTPHVQATTHPRIGVLLEDAEPHGARIARILPGSPASAAGLERDDVILSIDGTEIANRQATIETIGGRPAGPRRLGIQRGGAEQTIIVEATTAAFGGRVDRAACAEIQPDASDAARLIAEPLVWGLLAGVVALVGGVIAWARRKGVAIVSSVGVLVPFVSCLVLGPASGGLLVALGCSALHGVDVRLETIDLFVSEIVLTVLALGLFAMHRSSGRFAADGEPRLSFGATFTGSVAYVGVWLPRAFLFVLPIAMTILGDTLEEAPVAELLSSARRTALDATLMFIAAAILAPVAEETLFRGVLLPYFSRLTTPFRAVFATALVFGLMHIGGHGPMLIGPMTLGAILGWSRVRSQGLAAPIALHMTLNSLATLMAFAING